MMKFIGKISTHHPEAIRQVKLENGKIFSLGYDGRLEERKIKDIMEGRSWENKQIIISEEKNYAFTCKNNKLFVGTESGKIFFADLDKTNEFEQVIELGSKPKILVIKEELLAVSGTKSMVIWNIKEKEEVAKFMKLNNIPDELYWEESELYGLGVGGIMEKYRTNGEIIHIVGEDELLEKNIADHPFSFTISGNEVIIGTEEGTIIVYSMEKKKLKKHVEIDNMRSIQQLLFHKSTLFCCIARELLIISYPELKILQRFPLDDGLVESIDYQDGFFAAGTANGTVWLWKKEE